MPSHASVKGSCPYVMYSITRPWILIITWDISCSLKDRIAHGKTLDYNQFCYDITKQTHYSGKLA